MNVNFKFGLGDKVVVPYISDITEVVGQVDQMVVYRDGSKQVHVRWGRDGSVHSNWFTEKELKMATKKKAASAHPKKKPVTKKKTVKKKTTRRVRARGGSAASMFG